MDDSNYQVKPARLFATTAHQLEGIYEGDAELETAVVGWTLATFWGLHR